jgi:putative tryptophan/tyrosine transport system substrate-binding protein
MRRREFLLGMGLTGAALTRPLVARAQQPSMPVIGFLRSSTLADAANLIAAFRQGLKETGYVEGQNVATEYRFAENDRDKLTALVKDFIHRPVAVIAGNLDTALAAKAATTTVPIVFATGTDPVKDGLVTNLKQPGGNVTGVSFFAAAVGAKRLEQLRQLAPSATIIGVLETPDNTEDRKDVEVAARAIGQQLIVLTATNAGEIQAAFATFAQRGVGALIVTSSAFTFSNRNEIVALAARYGLPASYGVREFATAGGLTSYGASITDAYRQVGVYAGQILKGEKPGDLPVIQSAKFEFVINLKAAKRLGLPVPLIMQMTADEVIE